MTAPSPAPQSALCSTKTLLLGLRVLWSEVIWQFLRLVRAAETRQMRGRLAEERSELARLEASGAEEAALTLSRKQISFLHDELALLEAERAEARTRYVDERVRRWRMGE